MLSESSSRPGRQDWESAWSRSNLGRKVAVARPQHTAPAGDQLERAARGQHQLGRGSGSWVSADQREAAAGVIDDKVAVGSHRDAAGAAKVGEYLVEPPDPLVGRGVDDEVAVGFLEDEVVVA